MNEENFWIDDCFRINQSPWGSWHSYNKKGEGLVTAYDKESCIMATRFYLKGKQEGWK